MNKGAGTRAEKNTEKDIRQLHSWPTDDVPSTLQAPHKIQMLFTAPHKSQSALLTPPLRNAAVGRLGRGPPIDHSSAQE